jgi:fructose-specific phosphotransferase system component IIB
VAAHVGVVGAEGAVDEAVHEDEAPARAVVLVLEVDVRGARRQAEAAVHAQIEAGLRGIERRAREGRTPARARVGSVENGEWGHAIRRCGIVEG